MDNEQTMKNPRFIRNVMAKQIEPLKISISMLM